jgi:hypothetical protein
MNYLQNFCESLSSFWYTPTQSLDEIEQQHAISEQDRAVVERDRAVVERDRAVVERERDIIERERVIAERERDIAERGRDIAERELVMTERECELEIAQRDQDDFVEVSKRQVTAAYQSISEQNSQNDERERQIEEVEQDQNAFIAATNRRIAEAYAFIADQTRNNDERERHNRFRESENTAQEQAILEYERQTANLRISSVSARSVEQVTLQRATHLDEIADYAVDVARDLYNLETHNSISISYSLVTLIDGHQEVRIVQFNSPNIVQPDELDSAVVRPEFYDRHLFVVRNVWEQHEARFMRAEQENDQQDDQTNIPDQFEADFEDDEEPPEPYLDYVTIYTHNHIVETVNVEQFSCPICINDFDNHDAIVITKCQHKLCLGCANDFFNSSKVCMLCRSPLKTETQLLVESLM